MADVVRRIGLSLGADLCWPICYEEILKNLKLALPIGGDTVRFEVERVSIEPFDLQAAGRVRRAARPGHPLVPHVARVDQESGRDERPLRAQQSLVDPGQREAHQLRRDDAPRAAGARDLDAAAQGVRADQRPPGHARALRADVQPEVGGREGRLPGVPQAVRRRRLGGRLEGRQRRGARQGLRQLRPPDHASPEGGRAVRPLRARGRRRSAGPPHEVRPGSSAPRPLQGRLRLRQRRGVAAHGEHVPDDQLVLRLGFQQLRGAAAGRRLLPDRLRQRLSRLAGHLAALPLPVAGEGQAQVVALRRGDAAQDAQEPRLGAVLRDRRLRRVVQGEAAALRAARAPALRERPVRRVLRRAVAASRRGRLGVLRHADAPRRRCARRSRRSSRPTRWRSSPSTSGAWSSSGAAPSRSTSRSPARLRPRDRQAHRGLALELSGAGGRRRPLGRGRSAGAALSDRRRRCRRGRALPDGRGARAAGALRADPALLLRQRARPVLGLRRLSGESLLVGAEPFRRVPVLRARALHASPRRQREARS